MKRLLYLMLFLIQSFIVNGQRGYYVKDSLLSVGVKLIDMGAIQNAKQCQVIEKEKTLIYSPDEVTEYGFKDGSVFISRVIKINAEVKKVFLERLNKGTINLYYYKDKNGKKFFLEKDHVLLVEILKKGTDNLNYKEFLKSYIQDCNNVSEALKLMTYSKISLTKFIDQYNSCKTKPFPFISYGLSFGYSITNIVNNKINDDILKTMVFKNDNSFNIGAFVDIPILLSYFSFHPEMYYQKNTFSCHIANGNSVNDVIINTSSINVPCLIRYTYPSIKFRPFINVGGNFTYNFKNDNTSYSASISNEIIEISQPNTTNIYSNKQIGYSIGGGIQFKLDYRRNVFVEILNNHLFSITDNEFSNNSLQILIGLNL